jgi:hypothetical protein
MVRQFYPRSIPTMACMYLSNQKQQINRQRNVLSITPSPMGLTYNRLLLFNQLTTVRNIVIQLMIAELLLLQNLIVIRHNRILLENFGVNK